MTIGTLFLSFLVFCLVTAWILAIYHRVTTNYWPDAEWYEILQGTSIVILVLGIIVLIACICTYWSTPI